MTDLGSSMKILRMEKRRDRALGRLWLSQSGHVGKMFERFSMENTKTSKYTFGEPFKIVYYTVVKDR